MEGQIFCSILYGVCSVLGTVTVPFLCLDIVRRLDREEVIVLSCPERKLLFGVCLIAGLLVKRATVSFYMVHMAGVNYMAGISYVARINGGSALWEGECGRFVQAAGECLLLGIIAGCLVFAAVTDLHIGKAYDFTWWVGAAAGLLLVRARQVCVPVLAVLGFVLLQELFFSGFYGRADCHAFSLCALTQGAFGLGLRAYLLHMAAAFFLLMAVQGIKGNIGKRGNLKKPVPFLPYIGVAFGLALALMIPNERSQLCTFS